MIYHDISYLTTTFTWSSFLSSHFLRKLATFDQEQHIHLSSSLEVLESVSRPLSHCCPFSWHSLVLKPLTANHHKWSYTNPFNSGHLWSVRKYTVYRKMTKSLYQQYHLSLNQRCLEGNLRWKVFKDVDETNDSVWSSRIVDVTDVTILWCWRKRVLFLWYYSTVLIQQVKPAFEASRNMVSVEDSWGFMKVHVL